MPARRNSSFYLHITHHAIGFMFHNLPEVYSPLCGKSYQCPVLGTCFGSTGTWYPPGPSAGEHHLPLVLVYHHGRQQVTGLLFFVVHTQINSGK